MMEKEVMITRIKQQGILPLFFHSDKRVCLDIVRTLYDLNITCIEFTNRGEAALENFKAIVAERNKSMPNLLLAAGTIETEEHVNQFIKAGADFLISPFFDNEVCSAAKLKKAFWIPGCMTPTEIHQAKKAGCTLLKLFPGNVLGPSFVSGIKELFPKIDFMPTGGVELSKENISAWFKAGVCAVGMGSKLIDKEIMESKNYTLLTERAKQVLSIVAEEKAFS